MDDRELQTLRNMGNEAEAAADEIDRLNFALKKAADRIEALEAERQRWQVALEGEAEAKGELRKAEARIEADRAAMQQALEAYQLAEHALTFAPASYEELLSARHDAVDDLRAATEALRERLA